MIHLLYEIVLWIASLFFIPYHLFRSFQRGRPPAMAERFGFIDASEPGKSKDNGPILVHSVSVGETIAAKPFLRALKAAFPDREIVISNVTETGRSIAMTIPEADRCIYFPFDFRFAVRRVLKQVKPAIILVVETEIWPNFLHEARKMNIPSVLVNGRISDRSFPRYCRLGWFFRAVLADFSWFCMQSAEDSRRIVAIGASPDRVEVAGNLKYDITVAAVSTERAEAIRTAFLIPGRMPVFTAGSTHQGEEEVVIHAYQQLIAEGADIFLVLVPRHPERATMVASLLTAEKIPFTLRSAIGGRTMPFSSGEVLVVDTVGELMQFYAVSDVVFVGGSLVPTGGHNILEPASLRVPVLFGPHMSNFREAAESILVCRGGIQINDAEDLAPTVGGLLADRERRYAMGGNGARLLEKNSGSTRFHIQVVERLLKRG